MKRNGLILIALALLLPAFLHAQDDDSYKRPPKVIEDLVLAKPMPSAVFNHTYTKAVVAQRNCQFVPLAKLAGPEMRIGGIRFNPENNSETRESFSNSIWLLDVATGAETVIGGVPQDAEIKSIIWSPGDKYFCFINNAPSETELWRVDVTAASPVAAKINANKVNAILGSPYTFLDEETILYKSVPADLGAKPRQSLPKGPIVQENLGEKNAARTYEDLIASPFDEECYQYYCTSVFSIFSPEGTRTVGEPSVIRSYELSPDHQYMLVTTEHRPFSYTQGHNSFPSKLQIRSIDGKVVKTLRDGTVKEEKRDMAPKDSVRKPKEPSRKNYAWRSDKPATLTWTVSGEGRPLDPDAATDDGKKDDDGDDDKEKEKPEKVFVDTLFQCGAPFDFDDAQVVFTPMFRFVNVTWGDDSMALCMESSGKQKFRRQTLFTPCDTNAAVRELFRFSTDVDTVGDFPVYGKPYTVRNGFGRRVLRTDAKHRYLYFTGDNRPDAEKDPMSFIDRYDLRKDKLECLWMGSAPYQETVTTITDFDRLAFISNRQSNYEAPNYYKVDARNYAKGKVQHSQITFFKDEAGLMDHVRREFVSYKRKDGVTLTSNLWLPKDYDKERDGKLPVLLWAYPREYKSVAAAEKARPSRYNYMVISRSSAGTGAVIWAAQGYAVLEGASMYIIAEDKDKEPNDVYLQQLVMDAEAAIDFVDSEGVGDRERVAVTGHSYGGFMTANLLAHTKLFKAGIARSGAYNRTLTPYGFQSEGRSYWKAKKVYDTMSPFNYADSLKTPIMLVHGIMDNNSGTFPIQSERLYQAIKGQGGTVRYLQLPYESHGYTSVENVLHLIYETTAWMDKYMSKEAIEKAKSRKNKK